MAGLISTIFSPDAGDSASGNSSDVTADGGTGLDLSPSIAIETSGSHENADGSTTEWSNATEVGADLDLDASYVTTLGMDDASAEG